MQWDSQVTMTYKLVDLRSIHLLNYRLIESLDDPDENLITVVLTFAPLNHEESLISIVDRNGEIIQRPDNIKTTGGYQPIEKL